MVGQYCVLTGLTYLKQTIFQNPCVLHIKQPCWYTFSAIPSGKKKTEKKQPKCSKRRE